MSKKIAKTFNAASVCLSRFATAPLGHFINGKPYSSHETSTFTNINPEDGTALGEVVAGTPADIDIAAQTADHRFHHGWKQLPGKKRAALMHSIADAIEARAEEIALIESSDTGQPIRFMRRAALRGAENFRFFGDRAAGARDGLSLPADHHLNYTMRQPLGTVGVITPWNTPFMLSSWKIAPALAAGCTIVHKPAEFAPLSARLLIEIAHEAGLPDGVWNLVNGRGEDAGKALTEHKAVKAIAFVGESATGSLVQAQSALTLKPLHLELGGKNPVIVFDDADIERALDAVIFMIYSLNGERCTSASRLLVQETIKAEFCARLAERVMALKIGYPLDPETEIGPLIHPSHLAKVCSYFDIARKEGASILVGGNSLSEPGKGCFVQPTLITQADNSMRVAREEIFGPVLTCMSFSDENEALSIANDTPYGLAAYLWTGNTGRAHRLARDLEAGMIWVNSENNRHLPTPFGGMKASGIGRDGGDWSFDFYMETRNVCIAYDTHSIPQLGKA